ncbi:MAG TPA: CoA transferase, partial [Bacteroidia bacterium]|nr:CoA transferase [Bacteroidia bacterium]
GTAQSGPVKLPLAFIDILAAHQLKEALLIALIKRLKTGEGSYVSVSLYDAALTSLANQASNYLQTGAVPGLLGSLHPNIAPYGELLLCKDGQPLVLAVGNDKQFALLCRVLRSEELIRDSRFRSNPVRVKYRAALLSALQEAAVLWTSEDLKKELDKLGVPCGRIYNMAEVFAASEAKKLILEENKDGSTLQCVKTIAFLFKKDV